MKGFFSSKTEQSITRLAFFMIVVGLIVWETYAVFTKGIVPHVETILVFAGATLANKQFQERKENVVNNTVEKPESSS